MSVPEHDNVTRQSLLLRLRDGSNDADWERFYDLYSGLIYHYARKRGCSDALAADVVQETLLVMSQRLPTFAYDPTKGKFRSWLLRIVHFQVVNAFRREQKYCLTGDAAVLDHEAELGDDELEMRWESEWQDHLLQLGLAELERTMATKSYRSFCMSVLEGQAVEDVAAVLQLDRNTIYQHRHRGTQKLKQIIASLAEELGDLA